MDAYHVKIKGQALGPYSLDRIRQMVRKGQVGRANEVSTDGMSWAPATSFPEIFERPAQVFVPAVPIVQQPEPVRVDSSPAPAPVAATLPREPQWYCGRQGQSQGPMPRSELVAMIRRGEVTASDYVFQEGGAEWILAGDAPELATGFPGVVGQAGMNAFCRECGSSVSQKAFMCPKCGAPTDSGPTPMMDMPMPMPGARRSSGERKSKTVAAVLAFLIGGLGVHHFYLGNAALGIVYILFCWTFIPALISFVEAIVFLTMSDAAFDEKYNS